MHSAVPFPAGDLDDRDQLIAHLHERIDDGTTTLLELIRALRTARLAEETDAASITVGTAHKVTGPEWEIALIANATSCSRYSPDHAEEIQRLF